MTDSPEIESTGDQEESWAAFDDVPAASSDFTGGDADDFGKQEDLPGVADEGDEDEDEWNDFEFASAPAPAPPPPIADQSQEVQSSPTEPTAPEESHVTASASLPALQASSNPSLSVETLICDLGQILNTCLVPASSNDEEVDEASIDRCSDNRDRLNLLSDLIGESDGDRKSEDASDTMAGEVLALWTSLRLIEEAAALRYQWGESKVYDRHLQALRMDLKLAKIRNPKLPAFAWQLSNSALTPEKPVGSATTLTPSTSVTEHKSPSEDYATPDSSTIGSVSASNQNGVRIGGGGGGSANGAVVAPVQFDWNSSGLMNPLSEGAVDSGSMDLDYFSSSKAVSSPSLGRYDLGDGGSVLVNAAVSADAWKTDLKLLGLMAEDDSNLSNTVAGEISQSAATISKSSVTSASLLEKLMNSNHRTTSGRLVGSSSESALSNEARRLLDTLPDLSFMVSPVLMFPIREDLSRTDGGDDVQL